MTNRHPLDELDEAKREGEEASRLLEEVSELRITNPDSPRIESLLAEASRLMESVKSRGDRAVGEVNVMTEAVDKAERLTFDLHKHLTTLCATLIVALLALLGVFEGTEGLRSAVGEASASLAYSVGASVLALLMYTTKHMDFRAMRARSEAPVHQRLFGEAFVWVGRIFNLVVIVASTAALMFFFDGLITIARFLEGA